MDTHTPLSPVGTLHIVANMAAVGSNRKARASWQSELSQYEAHYDGFVPAAPQTPAAVGGPLAVPAPAMPALVREAAIAMRVSQGSRMHRRADDERAASQNTLESCTSGADECLGQSVSAPDPLATPAPPMPEYVQHAFAAARRACTVRQPTPSYPDLSPCVGELTSWEAEARRLDGARRASSCSIADCAEMLDHTVAAARSPPPEHLADVRRIAEGLDAMWVGSTNASVVGMHSPSSRMR